MTTDACPAWIARICRERARAGGLSTLPRVVEAELSSRVWQTNGGSTYHAAGSEFGPEYWYRKDSTSRILNEPRPSRPTLWNATDQQSIGHKSYGSSRTRDNRPVRRYSRIVPVCRAPVAGRSALGHGAVLGREEAGCEDDKRGGHGRVGRALVAGAVQPAPAATSSSPTPAAARAEAAEINLVGPDLPGWRQSPNVTSSADAAMADRLASCVGTRPPTSDDVVDVNSPYFDQGNAEVTSNVVVVRSHSDGIQDLAAMKSGKLLPCIRKVSVPYLKSQVGAGVTLSAVTINEVHLNWLPSSSFGYRVSIVLSAKASSGATANEDLSSDSYGFLVGQAEVELDATETSAPGSAKPSSALEQRLVHLLDRRASKFAG